MARPLPQQNKGTADRLLLFFGGTSSASGGSSADTTPDAFTFIDLTDAELSTLYESNTITLTGLDGVATVTVVGGEYQKNGLPWVSAPGTGQAGDTFKLRGLSSAGVLSAVNVSLTLGGVSDTWTITTEADPGIGNFRLLSNGDFRVTSDGDSRVHV
jgi:hypothetical protein